MVHPEIHMCQSLLADRTCLDGNPEPFLEFRLNRIGFLIPTQCNQCTVLPEPDLVCVQAFSDYFELFQGFAGSVVLN